VQASHARALGHLEKWDPRRGPPPQTQAAPRGGGDLGVGVRWRFLCLLGSTDPEVTCFLTAHLAVDTPFLFEPRQGVDDALLAIPRTHTQGDQRAAVLFCRSQRMTEQRPKGNIAFSRGNIWGNIPRFFKGNRPGGFGDVTLPEACIS